MVSRTGKAKFQEVFGWKRVGPEKRTFSRTDGGWNLRECLPETGGVPSVT
jgi:hypothetical protein